MKSEPLTVEECAFEPESTEIHCFECGKPTGDMGTCRDIGFCTACRADYIDVGVDEGLSPEESSAQFSAMLISLIEGVGYKAKYRTKRVLHLSVDGVPVCGTSGGPHPLTANPNEVNCKRCLKRSTRKTGSMNTDRQTAVAELQKHGFGVVEDGVAVIVISSEGKRSIARRWESARVAAHTLIESKGFCSWCRAALTATDWQAGHCTQCGKELR